MNSSVSRSNVVSSSYEMAAGTPLTSEYVFMTERSFASWIAASKGNAKTSRMRREPASTFAEFSPPSDAPYPRKCLPVATTPFARSSPWRPAM